MSKPYYVKESPHFKPYKRLTFEEPEASALKPEDLVTSMRMSLSAWRTEDDAGRELRHEVNKYTRLKASKSTKHSSASSAFVRSQTSLKTRDLVDADLSPLMKSYFGDCEEVPLQDFCAALEFEFPSSFEGIKPNELLETTLADEADPSLLSISKLAEFSKHGFKEGLKKLTARRLKSRSLNEEIIEELEDLKQLLECQADQQKIRAVQLQEWEDGLLQRETELKLTLQTHSDSLCEEAFTKLQAYGDQLIHKLKLNETKLKESQLLGVRAQFAQSLQVRGSSSNPRVTTLERALVSFIQEHTKDKMATLNAENSAVKKQNARLIEQFSRVSARLGVAKASIKKMTLPNHETCLETVKTEPGMNIDKLMQEALQLHLQLVSQMSPMLLQGFAVGRGLLGIYTEFLLLLKDNSLRHALIRCINALASVGSQKSNGYPSKAIEVSHVAEVLDKVAGDSEFPPLKQFFRDSRVQRALCKELMLDPPYSLKNLVTVLTMADNSIELASALGALKELLEAKMSDADIGDSELVDKLLELLKSQNPDTKRMASEVLLGLSFANPALLTPYISSPLLGEIVETAVQDSSLFNRSHDIEENLVVLFAKLSLSSPTPFELLPSLRQALETRRSELASEGFLHKNISAIL